MALYDEYLNILRKAAKHNEEYQNNWPWTPEEITALTVRASYVADHARSEARRMRRASSNAIKKNNQPAACHFTEKAIGFDADAVFAEHLLCTIDTWHIGTNLVEAIFSTQANTTA